MGVGCCLTALVLHALAAAGVRFAVAISTSISVIVAWFHAIVLISALSPVWFKDEPVLVKVWFRTSSELVFCRGMTASCSERFSSPLR